MVVSLNFPTGSGSAMKRKEYLDFKKQQEKEFAEFPIAYAFNEQQLKEALEKLGATKDECVTVFGHGDIVKKTDAKRLIELLERHTKELKQKLIDDIEFAEAAFLYEMDNHEYAINWSARSARQSGWIRNETPSGFWPFSAFYFL